MVAMQNEKQKELARTFATKSKAMANRGEDWKISTEDTNTCNQMQQVERLVAKHGKFTTEGVEDVKDILEEYKGTAPSKEEVEFIVEIADQDKSGCISPRELAVAEQAWQAYCESKAALELAVKGWKDELQKSGSDEFSREEWGKLLESVNEGDPVTEPAVDYLIEQADRFKDIAKALTAAKFRHLFPWMLTSGPKEKVNFELKKPIAGFILNQTILKRFRHDKVKLSVVGEWSLGDKILKINGKDMENFQAIGNEMRNFPKPVEVERPLVCGMPYVRASVYTVAKADTYVGDGLLNANKVLYYVGTGVYHVGIVVYGNEFSYGYFDNPVKPKATGVDCVFPGRHPMHQFQEFVDLGTTEASRSKVAEIVMELSGSWLGNEYHYLSHNCVSFSQALAKALGVRPVPEWCESAAKAARTTKGTIAATAPGIAIKAAGLITEYFSEEVDDERPLGVEWRRKVLKGVFDQLIKKKDQTPERFSLLEYKAHIKKHPDYAFTAFFDTVRAEGKGDYITGDDFVDFHLDAWKEMTDDNFQHYADKWLTLLSPFCSCQRAKVAVAGCSVQ